MPVKGKTVRRLGVRRYDPSQADPALKLTSYIHMYEVHSGILDYRTGTWIKHHQVDLLALVSARSELKWRQDHPDTGQNACYIVRRYRHGSYQKANTNKEHRETLESLS